METAAAMDALRTKLESTFGKAMAMMILASASVSARVPTTAPSKADFEKLVDAACRDQRVLDMWGSAEAADVSVQLRSLVP